MAVREWDDNVVFLHKIVPGAADKSYGIHVARLAGVPAAVNERAKQIHMGGLPVSPRSCGRKLCPSSFSLSYSTCAASSSVGKKSVLSTKSLQTAPRETCVGQETMSGTCIPAAVVEPLPPMTSRSPIIDRVPAPGAVIA